MNELLQTHFPAAALEFSLRHLFFKQRDLIFLKTFQQFGNTPVCVEPLLAGSVRSIIILQESPHQWVRSMEHCTGQRARDMICFTHLNVFLHQKRAFFGVIG